MKNFMIVILISALTLSLVSTAVFGGIQQVRAEVDGNKDNKNDQVNTERQQINKCENNSQSEESDIECNNIVVYGVVCMPGAQCILDKYEVPFELVIPF